MSTSILYHGFGIRGYKYQSSSFNGGKITLAISQNTDPILCSNCYSTDIVRRGGVAREFKTLPIGSKPVSILFTVPRVSCFSCGLTRQATISFADAKKRHTRSFERYALELMRHMTIKDVADHLGISWDTAKEIQKNHLRKKFGKPKLAGLRIIAIDEISIGANHRYITVVLDMESGAIVYVGDGKGASALSGFFAKLRRCRAQIEAVAMDMSPSYISAVTKNLPSAVIVFDHFHVVKMFNDRLSDLRRELHSEVKTKLEKDVLKGTRWLILKNPENLSEEKNERERLDRALEINKPLATAYYMKEELRTIWSQADKGTAEIVVDHWIGAARVSGIRMLEKFADTLENHRAGILSYYDYRISTGPLEGTNNKIKTMKRQAYGFRDTEFFKLKIMALHQTKYALVG